MAIQSDFSISGTGDIRHTGGTTVYSILELHAWLQNLADDATTSGDDLLDIFSPNPSKLDGPRDPTVASRLNLLSSGLVSFNIDDDASQYFNFGSIKQDSANVQYSGLKTIGSIIASSPIYVVQNGFKLTQFWANGHIQILIKVKTAGSFIDSGNVTTFSRKWGQTYSQFDVNLSAGGESISAISTELDESIIITEAAAALLSSKVAITFGNTTQDINDGDGPKLYKGTITLSGGCTLQEAYQYLQYITREDSSTTLNSIPGWQYRVLNSAYVEIPTAPFGTFAGGNFFVAQGWWLSGVLPSEAAKYQLISDDDTYHQSPSYGQISITNGVANTRIQLYDLISNTELYNDIPLSYPFTYTDLNLPIITRNVRIRAMYQLGTSAKTFIDEEIGSISTSSPFLSYRLNQKDDFVYSTNGIDGSTVTTVAIDDALLLVKVTSSIIFWGTIYAYETYWLYTEEGIRDEGRFIEALDIANYKLYGFKIKNISSPSVPLIISGGYGVDGDTNNPLDIIDTTGGTIYCAPPHILPYASESTVTAADVWDYTPRTLTSGTIYYWNGSAWVPA